MRIVNCFTQSTVLVVLVSLATASLCLFAEKADARPVLGNTRMNVNRIRNIDRINDIRRHDNFRNININRNANVNINRDYDVRRYGHHGYHGDYHHYYRDHDDGIGVGAAVAIGIAGLAVGSIISSASMPPSCSMTVVNGLSYQRCGDTWYQPQYAGSQVNYVVVNPPR